MSSLLRSWRAVFMAVVAAALMVPATAASATPRNPSIPTPEPLPFSGLDCYLRCSSPALLRTTTMTLTVGVPGPEGAVMRAEFEVRREPKNNAEVVAHTDQTLLGAPGIARWRVPDGALTADTAYYWRARAFDERNRRSAWTPWQEMSVDLTPPEEPTVDSAEYPEKQWGPVLGTPGTFHFSSTSTDVVDFVWWVDAGPYTTTPATGTGPMTASVTFTPTQDMVNTLFVYARDPAGNVSPGHAYEFWVTPAPERFAHWTLDEESGTTAADSGNISAPGSLTGEVAFGPGYVGGSNGAWFTGDGGAITTAGPVLDTSQSYTVMAWVNPADLTLGDQTVLSQDGSDTSGFRLHYAPDANGGAGGWCFTVYPTDSPDAPVRVCADGSLAGPPVAGQWVHLAATYDAITNQIAVYVMGGENCLGESARSAFTSTWSAGGPFVIGQAMGGQRWRGGIDDVYAHQRLLADSEICQQALQ